MSVSTVHVLHGIVNSSTFISQISSARPMTDIQTLIAQSAGLPYPLFTATMGVNPAVPFETTQLKTILDLSGALTSIVDLSGANTDLYFKKVADLGRRVADASSAHMRFRMSQAFLSLDRISAGHNSEAVASCRLGTTYDGTNNPLVPAGSQTLSGTPASAFHYVAGPVSLNIGAGAAVLPGVQDITIEFNRDVLQIGSDGELYPTFVASRFYSPVVTIRCLEHVWASFGINGSALTGATFYLRKVAATGRVANATAEHIAFTATAGLVHVDEATGGNNDESMVTVRCTLVGADATTEPISCNTATAIS